MPPHLFLNVRLCQGSRLSIKNKGYVLAHRKAWDHPAFNNLREASIWNFLYQNAFWEDGERNFNGYTFQLKRGQIVVSISFLAKGFCMSDKGVRVVIDKLERLGMVVKQRASRGTVLTICNYDKFQCFEKSKGEQEGNRGAIEGQSKGNNNKQLNKETKETKNKEDIYPQDFLDIWAVYPKLRRGNKQKGLAAFKNAIKRDCIENINIGVQNYIDSDEANGQYAKGFAAWFNDDRWKNNYTNQPKGKNNELSKSGAADKELAEYLATLRN